MGVGSVGRFMLFRRRDGVQGTHSEWLTTTSSRGPDALSWCPQTLHTLGAHSHSQAHAHT